MAGDSTAAKGTKLSRFARLRDIVNDAGEVELLDGTIYRVKQLDGIGWDFADRLNSEERVHPGELYAETARVVPTAAPELIKALTAQQCSAVLQIAAGTFKAVEATAPNESGPTESAPETPSSA